MTRADEQLQRLLHAFPLMADEPDLSLATLAERVGTSAATLRADFSALDRDDVPAGWVDAIQVFISPQSVSMRSMHFKRPMRLTRPEVAALRLGLDMLVQELPADEQRVVENVRTKLQQLSAQRVDTAVDRRRAQHEPASAPSNAPSNPPTNAPSNTSTKSAERVPAAIAVEAAREHELERLAVLHDALEQSCAVDLSYQRADADAPTIRRVRPYAMVRAAANIYLVGHCELSDGLRVFRLDRVVAAVATADRFTIPADFSVESVLKSGRVFSHDDSSDEQLVVRYGPAVARWIAERETERDQSTLHDDGSLSVRYPLADAAWAVRHVLQYGPDAVIVSPDSLRADVQRVLHAMLD